MLFASAAFNLHILKSWFIFTKVMKKEQRAKSKEQRTEISNQ